MRLQTEPPLRMLQAVIQREPRIRFADGAIHGLEKEPLEVERLKLLRFRARLRKNELQFMSGLDHQFRSRFRADTDPIDARRWKQSPIRFDSYFKTAPMELIDERLK